MSTSSAQRSAKRMLALLAALIIGLYGLLLGAHQWGSADLTPKLGLDLRGGTQMVLSPVLTGSSRPTQEQLNQARDIINQRVDAGGISGAEVTTQGGQNIVVSMPEVPDRKTEESIRKPSQMRFRPVLVAQPGTRTPNPTATSTTSSGSATSGAKTSTGSATKAPSATATAKPSTSSTSANRVVPPALKQAPTVSPTPAATSTAATPSTPASTGAATPSASTSGKAATPKDAFDLAWVTDSVAKQLMALDCTKAHEIQPGSDDPKKPLVTCDTEGREKYVLGPVVVEGDKIADAQAGYQTLPNGQPGNTVEIALKLNGAGAKQYADVSTRMVKMQDPQNRLAAVLDSQVIVAPTFQSAITNGQASITGGFSLEQARSLAQQLKFGALPLSFTLETRDQISPTLGGEQLRLGLLFGLAGLILVVLYSLLQYHALGFVTVASLVISAVLTYAVITLLGWMYNLRLDMAGVTGLIMAIGVTADSFIVYFERIRDEVREGRPLTSAVEAGWDRAKRTVLAADAVNFLGAVVLYILAASGVRGFAFTLGLTTIIDLLIVFLFTHPVVRLLARTKFFGSGHRWSGLDPDRLGAKVRYVGRGRVTIADRRAAAAEGSAL